MSIFKKSGILLFALTFMAGCVHLNEEKKEELLETQTFYLSRDNLIYVQAQPMEMRYILSGLPGPIPTFAYTAIASLYLDYSPSDLQLKLVGLFPRNWINASLWSRHPFYENHSTLRETRFKSKQAPFYLSMPNKNLLYVSSTNFYQEQQIILRNELTAQSLALVEQSRNYPLYFKVASIERLLASLEIEVPSILRLPFDQIEGKLSLQGEEAELVLSFASASGSTPPSLAVRFALNFILSTYPDTPLTNLWKRVPITVNPENRSEVRASLVLSQEDFRESIRIIYLSYIAQQAEKEKLEREVLRKAKNDKKRRETNPLPLLKEILVDEDLRPFEE